MRDFVDDRTKYRWQSLLKLYTSGTPRKAADMPKIGRQMEPRLVAGKEPGVRRALRWDFGRSSQVSSLLEAPRETTLGQEDVD